MTELNDGMIKGFNHILGEHCESTAMRDVLEYIGLVFSEPMVFALDATMGFSYFRGSATQSLPIFVGGKQGTITENSLACRVLGVKITEEQFQSAERAWDRSKELLLQNRPLLIRIEMAYLPYIELPKGEFFGGHIMSLVGFDNENAFLYERDMKDPVELPIDVLKKARSSKEDHWLPPRNAHYFLEKNPKRPPLSAAVKLAIQQTVKNMLAASVNSLGLQGIKNFIQSIPSWKEILVGTKTLVNLELLHGYIEEYGTGGALFRNLFGDFLEEIVTHPEITGGVRPWRAEEINLVQDQLALIRQSAQYWTQFAREIKRAVDEGREDCVNHLDLQELENVGWEIYKLEETAFNNLKKIKI
ncbi:MAG: BtrH N-terminal domain-containing protein [Candidatus Helarchaeota archaeon]|nr:BtrH N-terminal domain-containing protein [Candidatus Helarchaeota archaeon]